MSLLKSFLLTVAIFSYGLDINAQDAPVFSQFLQNPFQFNPSYAAQQGHSEANIFYRKQWIGIENAPEVGALNIQTPVGRNVSLGITVISNKTVILNSSSALSTFAYRVRLGYYHHLNFGLAGGIGINNFDLDAVANANDPALANVVQKSKYAIGQFGINYQYKNFNIGFALPNIFDSKANTVDDFQRVEINPFSNKFGSLTYNLKLGDIELTPTVIYRALDNKQDQWEGMLLATYRGFLWLGASYRDGYGITGLIGVRLKNNYKVGYAYEYPTSSISRASSGSHEIYLGARFGKRDRELEYTLQKKNKDSLAQISTVNKDSDIKEKELADEKVEEKPIISEDKNAILVAPVIAVIPEKNEEPVPEKPEESSNYYVVLGAFRNQQNAHNQMKALKDKNIATEILYVSEKKYYFIYTLKTNNRLEAVEELNKERAKNRFPDAWIYQATIK